MSCLVRRLPGRGQRKKARERWSGNCQAGCRQVGRLVAVSEGGVNQQISRPMHCARLPSSASLSQLPETTRSWESSWLGSQIQQCKNGLLLQKAIELQPSLGSRYQDSEAYYGVACVSWDRRARAGSGARGKDTNKARDPGSCSGSKLLGAKGNERADHSVRRENLMLLYNVCRRKNYVTLHQHTHRVFLCWRHLIRPSSQLVGPTDQRRTAYTHPDRRPESRLSRAGEA